VSAVPGWLRRVLVVIVAVAQQFFGVVVGVGAGLTLNR
jgi:hypothetical protein